MRPIDERAKQILFDTIGARQRQEKLPAAKDLAYAKSKRMLLGTLTSTHDAVVARVMKACAKLSLAQVSAAFLASLTTRRFDLRSGLQSYLLSRELTKHALQPTSYHPELCDVCGGYRRFVDVDLDFHSFWRHYAAGSVTHAQLLYRMLDLEELAREPQITPAIADIAMMSAILATIASSAADDTPPMLSTRIKKVMPRSNKAERSWLIVALAECGVLVARDERKGFGEWVDARSWRGCDGYDANRVRELFGMHGL